MPHVNIKCYPGRTKEQKQLLAERITKDIVEIFNTDEKNVSIAIQDIPQDQWDKEVWDKEIIPQKDFLYKNPEY
ncbi:MAG: tautomerase family protein [Blautia sp.]